MRGLGLRLAWRTLRERPGRAAVLAGGFGFGVAVMATLLGVSDVVLEQARSPALSGGGDLVVSGSTGRVPSPRFLLGAVLAAPPLGDRVRVASPSLRAPLYLIAEGGVTAVMARGGVPSLQEALDDPELAQAAGWVDTAADAAWVKPDPSSVLRALDRFHAIPPAPAWAESWAEWLYFNGRSEDGSVRFYATVLAGPETRPGWRGVGIRLQLERGGRMQSYATRAEVEGAGLLAGAPDIDVGRSRVRLQGQRYVLDLDLAGESNHALLRGRIALTAAAGRAVPPITLHGARGWVSGYVVPALAGALEADLQVGAERLAVRGTGYHDHNWGFWRGVTWQWGQVAHEDVSLVWGRVIPPVDAADPARVPAFLAALGPQGPLGFSREVTITEQGAPGEAPRTVEVDARGEALSLRIVAQVESVVRTPMRGAWSAQDSARTFLQMRTQDRVEGTVAGRALHFDALGAAETFREQ
jgi:hypothetical protein